jgi:hypothetical protein
MRLFKADGTGDTRLQADYNGDGRIITQVLQITGGSDLPNASRLGNRPTPQRNAVSIDPEARSVDHEHKGYDHSRWRLWSGVNPEWSWARRAASPTANIVAPTGRVYCHVDARFAIRPGDLITTSDTPGHGMRSPTARAQGAIIGKAMTSLESGQGLVLVLVSLQ